MQTKALIARKLNITAAKAWEAIVGFDHLDVWFPSIRRCKVEGSGVGARRHMMLERGGEIVDHLVSIDHEERRLVYDRAQSPFPVLSYLGTVEVFSSFDCLAIVVWTVELEATREVGAAVAKGLETGIGAGIEGMGADLASTP